MQSIAETSTTVKESVNWTVAVAATEPTIRQRYEAGFDAYCAGAYADEVAHDPHMLRGFNAALNAEAAAAIGHDVAMGW